MNTKNIYGGKTYLGGVTEFGAASGGALNTSTMTAENMHMYSRYKHFGGQEIDLMGTGIAGQEHLFSQYRAAVFDGMALSDQFLWEYYSNVSTFN